MKKKIWIWTLSIIVVLAIGITLFFTLNKSPKMADNEVEELPVMVQKAKEEELVETILVTGKIVPEDEQKVYMEPEKGEISKYKVKENQKVKAGDPLFIYDSSKLNRQFDRAVRERDLIQSRAQTEINQIAELNKRITDTKKKVGVPQKVKSDDPEAEDETIIPVTQDDVNQLLNEKVQLELQYEGTKAEIEGAQEQINELDAQIKAMTVKSKINGIIVKVNKNAVNSETGVNEPVIHITSSKPFKVIGTMSEFDAVKIQKDQAVIVRPKVYKDREWKGVVETVSQFPNDEGGGEDFGGGMGGGNVTMYPFKVGITDDTTELRQGFHVSLEVKISGDGNSLVVPHMAIIDEDGMSFVYVLKDGKLERREIQTGKMNDEFIELTEGVSLGELVVTMPNEGMHDGMEVVSYDEVE
ncbi:efflux RND transporter periplasmic adaptor subunit [Lederbergia panacisoli]|uniref:efflux RND transporter periplasmic adaptor subunit n=1 Tax=Lederbergia panacisoli TaxID=1255251 RepID=UPI00214BE808|nr:biotin/lipoyl-binding protein [Lederbergia panacisoli]MCR2821679.1 HlyD family efflux transporter periplasmic adaptor subunit [Lederbergia panacisoli]